MNSNPNPNYKPPGCFNINGYTFRIVTDWTKHIVVTHKVDCVLFHKIKPTVEYAALKHFCTYCNFDFEIQQSVDQQSVVTIVFTIPIEKYIKFETSTYYLGFLKTLIDYASKPLEPEKPKYYSGKVVCIDARTNEFTKGKIYEVKNGRMKTDHPSIVEPQGFSPYSSFADLALKLASKFIELVENESEVEV